MCGISAIFSNKSVCLSELKDITDIIRHRGPDDEGYICFNDEKIYILGGTDTPSLTYKSELSYAPEGSINDLEKTNFHIGLGHRRLAILDISTAGHQPLSYLNGRYWIVFNGEIYNYLEIREELISFGYEFVSHSDTEVILAAYHHWGIACQDRFNGMWAFIIFDQIEKNVFISRDRFGIKPLYYWNSPQGDLYFASEIKQFTVAQGWEAKLNAQRAYDYLIYSFTDHTDQTMFKGVFMIPPGCCLHSGISSLYQTKSDKLKWIKWYHIPEKKYSGDFSAASVKFRQLFQDVIKVHLRSDVAVGSALSGGLDSSAIVCEINRQLKTVDKHEIQKTFSSCAKDVRYSEKQWMDIVTGFTLVDAYYVYPSGSDVFRLTPTILWHMDEPYQSQSAYLGWHVFESAKKNEVKVLLNGQGADEYLGGYGQYTMLRLKNLIKKCKFKRFFINLKSYNDDSAVGMIKTIFKIFFSVFPDSITKKLGLNFGYTAHLNHFIDFNILLAEKKHPNYIKEASAKSIKGVTKLLTFYTTLPKYLRWEDRNSMAHSVEARVPFLDYRLFEFAYNLPEEYLQYYTENKRVLREALIGALPEEIRTRKDKKGFITPEEMWVKEDYTKIFRHHLEESVHHSGGIIKPDIVK
jgi:asparagine synthase (glutamine-hydrolysing)